MENTDIHIGYRDGYGAEYPVAISVSDKRRHLYVIGQTGTGKSTLLENLVIQDIEAGRGVAFIDPHGDSSIRLLNAIPRHRIEDVVYFDPSDFAYPIAWNLLAADDPGAKHLVASGIVAALKSIWRDSWGPRLEYILYASLATLLECENVSILGVTRLLTDNRYRAWALRQVRDPALLHFWRNEFGQYDKRFLTEAIAPIQNKIGQLLLSPPIRNIFGQVRSKISARFLMDNRRIFIANLAKGAIGEDKANLIGALLVTQFQQAAMSRVDQWEDDREDFHLVIDEFQNFSTDSFASILAEARKYRLSLTLANQYLGQLSDSIYAAVLGNVGALLSFRVGETDALVLERAFGYAFRADQLVSLDNYHLCAKISRGGKQEEPWSGRTLAPLGFTHNRAATIVRRSREKYAIPREIVEDKLARWMGAGRRRG